MPTYHVTSFHPPSLSITVSRGASSALYWRSVARFPTGHARRTLRRDTDPRRALLIARATPGVLDGATSLTRRCCACPQNHVRSLTVSSWPTTQPSLFHEGALRQLRWLRACPPKTIPMPDLALISVLDLRECGDFPTHTGEANGTERPRLWRRSSAPCGAGSLTPRLPHLGPVRRRWGRHKTPPHFDDAPVPRAISKPLSLSGFCRLRDGSWSWLVRGPSTGAGHHGGRQQPPSLLSPGVSPQLEGS